MTFSLTTLVAGSAVALSAAAFVLWRMVQPSGRLGQMLHRTEKIPYHGEIDPRRFSDRDRD